MIVVSDTTAITTLLKVGNENLLKAQFGTVFVPQAVWDELLAFHSRLPEFIVLKPVVAATTPLPGTEKLGRGETEAIRLAKDVSASVLLVDDRKASAAAEALGIQCSSLLAVIVQAKRHGHLASVRATIESLEKRGGLYLSEAVKAEALHLAGEDQS